jgi:pyridinium-3,5-bisthiocarboxylic acid mononucleotide nickel chelatase
MILGALIDAGVDREKLVEDLSGMSLPDFDISVVRADRSGIAAAKAQVKVSHEHTARNLRDIELLISESTLSETVKSRAIQIFLRLGEAEARVHGIEIEKVHFHEVGAMDSIIDVVGCCVGFEMLGVEQFVSSKINVGHGFVKMGHGTFPVPPPAVAELLKGIPFYSNDVEGELTTPTGAAIISTLCDSYGLMPELTAEAVGYGAGTREYNGFPNVIRIIVGEAAAHVCMTNRERLVLLETNLDDLSPQISGYVVDHALQSGALDCWLTPIYMKKNRPAALLSVLCRESDRNALSEMIFRETSTLGIRAREVEREFLGREVVTVSTNFGDVAVKLGRIGEEIVNVMPEYENVKSLAIKHKVPFIEIRDAVLRAWETAREPKSEKANA